MRPMLQYLGGKWRQSKLLLSPQHDLVIEPFAGGAGYSLYYEPKQVLLIEKNPIVAEVWKYLIAASSNDIMKLPIKFDRVDELDIPQAAKWLIGLKISAGVSAPRNTHSSWGRDPRFKENACFWNERGRRRIAEQCGKIDHWEMIEGDYSIAPDVEAHWEIDPPYIVKGKNYPVHSIDYKQLATWCKSRRGYTIVHENEGATWLPFGDPVNVKSMGGKFRSGVSKEVTWTQEH